MCINIYEASNETKRTVNFELIPSIQLMDECFKSLLPFEVERLTDENGSSQPWCL